jgi:hypothetical protein
MNRSTEVIMQGSAPDDKVGRPPRALAVRPDLPHDASPILDLEALRSRGLTDEEARAVLRGSACVSEQELADRWEMRHREGQG